jgi:hypothetical protein
MSEEVKMNMKYEESKAAGKPGTQSCILELRPELHKFLDVITKFIDEDFATNIPVLDILLILAGECCEGDYVKVSEDDNEQDAEALYETVFEEHSYKPMKNDNSQTMTRVESIAWLQRFITALGYDYEDIPNAPSESHDRGCLQKRIITWG